MARGFPYEAWTAAVERHHLKILVAACVLLGVAATSLLRLRLDMDVLSELPSRSPTFQAYGRFLRTFGALDSLVVLVRGGRSTIIRFAEALAERLSRVDGVASVRYRLDLERVRSEFLGPFRYELLDGPGLAELEGRLTPSAIRGRIRALRRALALPGSIGARRWLVADPLGVEEIVRRRIARQYADPLFRPASEYLLAPDGRALLLIVRPVRPAFDTIFAERLLTKVRETEAGLLAGPFRGTKITVGHTGSYAYSVADKKIIRADLALYFVFAPLAVLLVFHLGLRSLRILPFVTFPLLLAAAVTFALSLLFFDRLNMVSVAFAGIFYGLGIDSSIYFYGSLGEHAARRTPLDRDGLRVAVAGSLREIGAANVIASTTTAIAFVVIGFSDFTGVSQLGLMTAAAMVLNVIATFAVLPALVFAWGPGAVPELPPSGRFVEALARGSSWLANRRGPVLALVAALLIAAGGTIGRVRLDTDFSHLRPSAPEAEGVEREIGARFGRFDARGVVWIEGKDVDSCLRSAERVAEALERYRSRRLVGSYSSLTAFFPSAETAERRLDRFRALPRRRAAEALRAALVEEGFDVRAFSAALDDLVRDDRPRIRVADQRDGPLAGLLEQHLRRTARGFALVTYFDPAPGVSLGALRKRLRHDLPEEPIAVTGRELVEAEFARLLERELVWFLAAALGLNLLCVAAAERSLKRALALIAPTVAALVLYLGAIGWWGIAVDPVNLIVLPLLIGLGVDDSVYLAAHVRQSGDLASGMRRGVKPLILATATTVVGFGSLGLSRYPALARLGGLSALGLVLCVVFSLLLVPAFASWLAVSAAERNARR